MKKKVFRGVIIKNSKLSIIFFVSFLVLICGLTLYAGSVHNSGETSMMPYDFLNFTMDVPKGTFFDESIGDTVSTFREVNNEFLITYINSDGIYQEMLDNYNVSSSNSSVGFEDNLTIVHNINDDIAGLSFSELIIMGSDDEVVMIEGNDVDLLKTMASTFKLNSH